MQFKGEKEKHVYFAGQKTHPSCNADYVITSSSVLTFNDVVTNQGNGFDGGSGLFKAPVSGVYSFTFTGRNRSDLDMLTFVYVLHNGAPKIALSNQHNNDMDAFSMISGSWQMRLGKNDKVQLKVTHGALLVHCRTKAIFTGVLIEEL